MYIFAGANTIFIVLKWYLIIVTISSFLFGFIGLNAGHHHPEALHDGDAVRYLFDAFISLSFFLNDIKIYFLEKSTIGASIRSTQ